MTIESQVKQILALTAANTQTLTALTQAVADLHGTSGNVDLTPVTDALAQQNTVLAAIKNDLEGDDAPQPAPEPAPTA